MHFQDYRAKTTAGNCELIMCRNKNTTKRRKWGLEAWLKQ
jgi:hypothetical protein